MILLLGIGLACTAANRSTTIESPEVVSQPQNIEQQSRYVLKQVLPVAGRQGVACDGEFYYVSGSTSLYKYNKDGELIVKEEDPFKGYSVAANHIGDIDVFADELFLSIEWFVDGQGKDIQIAVHDAQTLQFKRSFPFDEASGQLEVSGIAVDREGRKIWMSSWVGGDSGKYLYQYDLDSGQYLNKLELNTPPKWVQGVFFHQGRLFLTADDGDAELDEYDHLYTVSLADENKGEVILDWTFEEVRRVGEIEGLAIDPKTDELLVHFNRGKRIVQGMPKGLYPGYEEEIHEVYVFTRKESP
jgi:5-oxoprolinase (ATP-hydrolysing) subunit C